MKKLFCLQLLLFHIMTTVAQDNSKVDFKHLKAEVTIHSSKKMVSGNLLYTFDVLEQTDSIFLDARQMEFHKVLLNGEEIDFRNDQARLWLSPSMEVSQHNTLQIDYSATPSRAMYFIPTNPEGEDQEFQVWTQGQGKETSFWMPSFDNTNEKLEFDLSILYKKGMTVAANGVLQGMEPVNDTLVRWDFDMKDPMSSYLVAIAAGDYAVKDTLSGSRIPIRLYFPRGQQERVEPTYRHSVKIMDFLENEIGVAFPWQNYKQIPVRDFLYAGMENTGTTIFSDRFLVDSVGYNDRNYVMVNAHELAHQWFGDLVTASSGEHHWLQEGFATYYALLAEREVFGEDYFYWKLYRSAEELKLRSDNGKGEAVMKPGANSLTVYQKGAWALHILKGIVGKKDFDRAVKNYLEKHAYSIVSTEDFLAEVEKASGKDLSNYKEEWLLQSAFQGTQAFEALKQSGFIQAYFEVASLKPLPLEEKKERLLQALESPVNTYIGQEVVHQLAQFPPSSGLEVYRAALDSKDLYVRQAVAVSLSKIPAELKQPYERLLEDQSYVTQEVALYNLWRNFPEDRARYLEELAGKQGFLDKNIRTLWLALKIATPETDPAEREKYKEELSGYTAPHNRFQLRQNAFGYLYQLKAFNSQSIHNLLEASRHHNYQFRTFAKELLRQVLESGALQPAARTILEKALKVKSGVGK